MDRPKQADFTSRIAQRFETQNHEGQSLGHWKLASVKTLEAPDEKDLRDLECFSMIFEHTCGEVLPQGYYDLKSEDGFQITLFAIPFRNDEMNVTIN